MLKELAEDEECDLIQEGGTVYCGNRQTTSRIVNELLGLLAISILYRDGFRTPVTNYGINDIGRSLLRRPELEAELVAELASRERRPFQVVDDRVRYI